MRAWSTPPARVRAARVRSCSRAEPRTLTHTVAWARSRVVCTHVTVTNPRPGSFSSWIPSDSTCFTASSTRRIRPPPRPGEPRLVIEAHHRALDRERLESLSRQPAFGIVEQTDGLADLPGRTGEGQPCPLPDIVVVDLGDRAADAVLQVRLHRLDDHPLLLQRMALGQEELERVDADEAGVHEGIV